MALRRPTKKSQRKKSNLIGAIVIGAAVVAVGAGLGVVKLWKTVTHLPEFQVRPISAVPHEPWLNVSAFQEDLMRTDSSHVLGQKVSIFTPGLARDVAEAFAENPWVLNVKSVRKNFPDKLDVNVELRKPFALVERSGQRCCLDKDGVVLSPRVYHFTPEVLANLGPVVILPDNLPNPRTGVAWDHEAVRAGLAMLWTYHLELAETADVEAIELATVTGSRGKSFTTAALVLKDGPRVQWGRCPIGASSPAEISTPEKIEAFRAVIAKEGDNLSRLRTINVRWHETILEAAN